MRKIILLLLFLFLVNMGYSQEIYFLTGKNYTNYKIRYNGSETVNSLEKKGEGDSYEIGLAIPMQYQWCHCGSSIEQ